MSGDEEADDTPRDRDDDIRTPPDEGATETGTPPADGDIDGDGDERPAARRNRAASSPDADDAPLSGLRANIDERRQRRQRPDSSTPDVDEVFDEASSEPVVDGEQIWEDLLAGEDDAVDVLAFGEPVEGEPEDVTTIKSSVCHNCKYFGEPPDLHCTHEGTTIRKMVDMDHYEVVDCPVVKNRSDLRD